MQMPTCSAACSDADSTASTTANNQKLSKTGFRKSN
jgi:hypothetical protein